ncbi:hypothetical protein PWK10_15135 [Caloramator sp. Dgby_cultured_2]|nr:hypothetical protein [Caloramator sp. Dgby_cultured_2]WDU82821.1 hypothetical protein PWK10_15135 [Caloramator sp. Dgby_cultured_2]
MKISSKSTSNASAMAFAVFGLGEDLPFSIRDKVEKAIPVFDLILLN